MDLLKMLKKNQISLNRFDSEPHIVSQTCISAHHFQQDVEFLCGYLVNLKIVKSVSDMSNSSEEAIE